MGEFTRAHCFLASAELATTLQAVKGKEGIQHQTFEPKCIAGSEQATLRRGKRKNDTTSRKTKKRHYVAEDEVDEKTECVTNMGEFTRAHRSAMLAERFRCTIVKRA